MPWQLLLFSTLSVGQAGGSANVERKGTGRHWAPVRLEAYHVADHRKAHEGSYSAVFGRKRALGPRQFETQHELRTADETACRSRFAPVTGQLSAGQG
jgi:hypothetical protein